MSEELLNHWQPRKPIILECPSGSTCEVQRPGPELGMRVAQLQGTLKAVRELYTSDEDGEAILAKMSDKQRQASLDVMRVTVSACVKRPTLAVTPKNGELGVDDIPPEDFLHIWTWYKDGCPDVPVQVGESEVAVDAVNNFPGEPGAGVGAGGNSGDVRAEAVEPVAA